MAGEEDPSRQDAHECKEMEEVNGHILKGGVDGGKDFSLPEVCFLKPGSATCLKICLQKLQHIDLND